jgi:ribosome-associated translation inhibitor RaiA
MEVDIRLSGDSDQGNELLSDLKRLIHRALDPFAAGIRAVIVRMVEADESQAGSPKQWRIRVELPSGVSIIQESRSDDVYAAVDRAVDRIRRFFSWQVQRAGGLRAT